MFLISEGKALSKDVQKTKKIIKKNIYVKVILTIPVGPAVNGKYAKMNGRIVKLKLDT